jgi:hypothetical protein
MSSIFEPQEFWDAYSEELNSLGRHRSKEFYKTKKEWGHFGKERARIVCRSRGLCTKCWLSADACGYENFAVHDWSIRVALEHENDNQWHMEICKLSHVIANLRVLVAYWNFGKGTVDKELLNRLRKLEDKEQRITRMPECKWLFIFGPDRFQPLEPNCPFVAYTLDNKSRELALQPLQTPDPVNPFTWP